MAPSNKFKSKLFSDVVNGAVTGFVIGVTFMLVSWMAAGIIKAILFWGMGMGSFTGSTGTGIWPEWFPGFIPDFILSGWWVVIIIVTFTVAGAIAGAHWRRRLKIL